MDKVIEYSPLIIAIFMFFINYKIFVTPADLEKKHREILNDIDDKYETKDSVADLKEQMIAIANKVDKIYDILLKKN